MSVSVIISNLNGARFLPRLIESLQAQEGTPVEIIVVDRESTDDSRAILARHPSIKTVSEPPLTGLVSGYHRGVREATHEHLFFVNEDMWFDKSCVAALESHISLEKRVAAADPWQWSYDGSRWIHGGTRFRPARWAINGVYPFRHFDFNVDLPEGAAVPFPCAGAFLIHRRIYEEVGGWDTSMFLDNEDIDLFVRVWQREWKCVTVPRAKVYHAVGMSNVQANGAPKMGAWARRYVSSRLGKALIPMKYFSAANQWMGWGNYFVTFLNNLLKLRFEMFKLDVMVLRDILDRYPKTRAARRANQDWNHRFPGERFFLAPEFQIGSL